LLFARWQPTDVIRIAFLDGADAQIALVKRFAPARQLYSQMELCHPGLARSGE
jgi:hypothetical protein